MKKKIMSALMAGIMVLGLAACGANDSKNETSNGTSDTISDTAQKKELRIFITAEPPNIDPQLSTDAVSFVPMNGILEGLTRVYKDTVQPGMAEKWDISDDKLTYTFHLRDALWSDGKPVTAQDFEYTIKRLLNPDSAAEYAYQAYYIKGGKAWNEGTGSEEDVAIKAIDEKTLEITLESPTPYFLELLSFSCYLPVREDIVTAQGQKFAADADKMIYNGPFVLDNWAHDEELILTKNDSYWDKEKINLDSVEISIFTDNKTAVRMYEDLAIDETTLGKDFIDNYKAKGLDKYYYDGGEFYLEINANTSNPETQKVLSNKNFRQAIGYAIDRQAFCDSVLKNGSDPATRYAYPLIKGTTEDKTFNEEYPLEFYSKTADKEKAKELLNKAAEELGTTVEQLPTIELLADEGDTVKVQVETVQAMLKEVGIKLSIRQVTFKQRLQLMTDKDFDIVMAGWSPDYRDQMTYLDLWVTGGGNNHINWSNARYDELIALAQKEADEVKRAEMLFEAEQILLEDAGVIPIYFRRVGYTEQPYVLNLVRNYCGPMKDFVYADIDLAKRAEILGE